MCTICQHIPYVMQHMVLHIVPLYRITYMHNGFTDTTNQIGIYYIFKVQSYVILILNRFIQS